MNREKGNCIADTAPAAAPLCRCAARAARFFWELPSVLPELPPKPFFFCCSLLAARTTRPSFTGTSSRPTCWRVPCRGLPLSSPTRCPCLPACLRLIFACLPAAPCPRARQLPLLLLPAAQWRAWDRMPLRPLLFPGLMLAHCSPLGVRRWTSTGASRCGRLRAFTLMGSCPCRSGAAAR